MPMLSIAQVIPSTEAEGPGHRFAVWFQGCPLRCPGCCNPEFLPFNGGTPTSLNDLVAQLDQARATTLSLEGVSLLGGEPFAHAEGAALFAKEVHGRGLTVMIYSGYTLEELQSRDDPATRSLLEHCDLLVDGPYRRDLPETRRRWIGSTNQRVHFLSDRYSPADPCWTQGNTLEIRLTDGVIEINGFPAPAATGLWKPRWTRPLPQVKAAE